jgi:hypothetical protein
MHDFDYIQIRPLYHCEKVSYPFNADFLLTIKIFKSVTRFHSFLAVLYFK